jgi:hypothetical protein
MLRVWGGILGGFASGALALAVACSSFDTASARSNDASDDSTAEGGVEAGRPRECAWNAPFTTPKKLTGLNVVGGHLLSTTFTPDELTVIASRADPSGDLRFHLYLATRPDLTGAFSPPQRLLPSAPGEQLHPSLSPDTRRLFFTKSDSGTDFDIVTAERLSDGGFGDPSPPLNTMSGASTDVTPFMTADGKKVYFASIADTSVLAIYRAPYPEQSVFGERVAELTPDAGVPVAAPVVSADELTIWYSVGVASGVGLAEDDIYVAHRTSVDGAFGPGTPVAELNAPQPIRDAPVWISRDSCRLYFASNRSGWFEVYVATRE